MEPDDVVVVSIDDRSTEPSGTCDVPWDRWRAPSEIAEIGRVD